MPKAQQTKRMHAKIASDIFIDKLLQKFLRKIFAKSREIINENFFVRKQNAVMSVEINRPKFQQTVAAFEVLKNRV